MEEKSCIVCGKGNALGCMRCKSCNYCSQDCQKNDWPSHKLLCSTMANFDMATRPSPLHKLGIFFPPGEKKPRLVWVHVGSDISVAIGIPVVWSMLELREGESRRDSRRLSIMENPRDGAPLKHSPSIFYRHLPGPKPNLSTHAATDPHGPQQQMWTGPVILVGLKHLPHVMQHWDDVTLGDLRLFVDFTTMFELIAERALVRSSPFPAWGMGGMGCMGDFTCCGWLHQDGTAGSTGSASSFASSSTPSPQHAACPQSTPAPDLIGPPDKDIMGVQINCEGELLSSISFMQLVRIPPSSPLRRGKGTVSPVSRAIGRPLLALKFRPKTFENSPDNMAVLYLMMQWGMQSQLSDFGLPDPTWHHDLGNVLVMAEDGRDVNMRAVWEVVLYAFLEVSAKVITHVDEAGRTPDAKLEALNAIHEDHFEEWRRKFMPTVPPGMEELFWLRWVIAMDPIRPRVWI